MKLKTTLLIPTLAILLFSTLCFSGASASEVTGNLSSAGVNNSTSDETSGTISGTVTSGQSASDNSSGGSSGRRNSGGGSNTSNGEVLGASTDNTDSPVVATTYYGTNYGSERLVGETGSFLSVNTSDATSTDLQEVTNQNTGQAAAVVLSGAGNWYWWLLIILAVVLIGYSLYRWA